MPRQARIVIPNTAHHVTQRGNYQQDIFERQEEYIKYCNWIDEYAQQKSLEILAYCLMRNHVHFIVIPKEVQDLSEVFKVVHMRYSHYKNRQRSAKGHLWQGRFYSCILDDAHVYRAIRYVEKNPVRAKAVKNAWEYKWSSAQEHTGERNKALITLSRYKGIKAGEQWKEYLQEDDPELTEEMRVKTERGLVVGGDNFIKNLEGVLNRSLACVKQGRPKGRK
ncbi:MAG: transposase [Candidatus Omnitrophica bacterium]|nr:transposase [Candidatus Omnitrophota bacterium]MBU2221399.1 transposase [Candidatus Omnitrophota bacterium]MBU2258743.1 transposase [Candidatus Omnitrophota bacterium]